MPRSARTERAASIRGQARELGGPVDPGVVSEDGDGLGDRGCIRAERRDPAQHESSHALRGELAHLLRACPRRLDAARHRSGDQLAQQQRVAGRPLGHGGAELRVGVGAVMRGQQRGDAIAAEGRQPQDRCIEAVGDLVDQSGLPGRARAHRRDHQHPEAVEAAREVGQVPQRRLVAPVQVVDREDERPGLRSVHGQPVEPVQGAVRGLGGRQPTRLSDVEHRGRELRCAVEQLRARCPSQRGFEQLADDPERVVLLELAGPRPEGPHPGHLGALLDRREQPRLADPGRPFQDQQATAPGASVVEQRVDRGKCLVALLQRHLHGGRQRRTCVPLMALFAACSCGDYGPATEKSGDLVGCFLWRVRRPVALLEGHVEGGCHVLRSSQGRLGRTSESGSLGLTSGSNGVWGLVMRHGRTLSQTLGSFLGVVPVASARGRREHGHEESDSGSGHQIKGGWVMRKSVIAAIAVGALVAGGAIYAVSGGDDDGRKAAIGDEIVGSTSTDACGGDGVYVKDAAIVEANSGTSLLRFDLTAHRSDRTADILDMDPDCSIPDSGTVKWRTIDDSAKEGSDFVNPGGGTVQIYGHIDIPIKGDVRSEYGETFGIQIYDPSPGVYFLDTIGKGTIKDDDFGLPVTPPSPKQLMPSANQPCDAATTSLSIDPTWSPVFVAEPGNSGVSATTIGISRCGGLAAPRPRRGRRPTAPPRATATQTPTSVTARLWPEGLHHVRRDRHVRSRETYKTFPLPIIADQALEARETLTVSLSAPSAGATIYGKTRAVYIYDDDVLDYTPPVSVPGAHVSISDASVTKGNSATKQMSFTIDRSGDVWGSSTVNWSTVSGTAAAGSDFTAASGTATFDPGEPSQTVTVTVSGDTAQELDETFQVKLSGATGAAIDDATAVGTIVSDDVANLAIGDVTVTKGNSGTTDATFKIVRSGGNAVESSVSVSTADGTATTGNGGNNDYVPTALTPVKLAAGESSKTVTVKVNGDGAAEANETFSAKLSSASGATIIDPTGIATVLNDDTGVSVDNVSVMEGDSGSKSMRFTVTRSGPNSGTASVAWATAYTGGSAGGRLRGGRPRPRGWERDRGKEYLSGHDTLSFGPGETTKYVDITAMANSDGRVQRDVRHRAVLAGQRGHRRCHRHRHDPQRRHRPERQRRHGERRQLRHQFHDVHDHPHRLHGPMVPSQLDAGNGRQCPRTSTTSPHTATFTSPPLRPPRPRP